MGSSKKQTVGYRYFMGLHFGICQGPVDALLQINAGDRNAWDGTVRTSPIRVRWAMLETEINMPIPESGGGPATESKRIRIVAPELFGGDKKEGGIMGWADVMMGEAGQAPNDYLVSQLGNPMPAFRGILSLVFRKGMVGAMNPYPKAWAFKVRRILQGWSGGAAWYPAKAQIDLGGGDWGMNPAHIVYETLTNTEWGMGYPPASLDLASFAAAADTFHAEGMGLCFQWVRSDSIEGFVQDVMNHAGGVLAQDPRTSLFRIIPIRGGYTVATLPEFRRGLNVIEVESFQRAAVSEAVNEITVTYTDVSTGKAGTVTVQQLANIQAQGGVVSQGINYVGIPTSGLASRVALRDLAVKSQPLCKVKIKVDRSAYGILPGQVVRWSDARLGIVDMPMRVLQINYGTLTAGTITMDLAEDVFGLPATGYVGQQPSGWVEPPMTPQPPPASTAMEVPLVAIYRGEGASVASALDSYAGFVGMAATKPAGVNYGFALYTRVGAAAFEETGAGDWTPGGPIAAALPVLATAITLDPPRGLDEVSVGDLAQLGDGPLAELVRITAVSVAAGTVSIARGCGDTTPRAWPAGTRLWVLEQGMAASGVEYAQGEVVDAKALTQASGGLLPLADAPTHTVTMARRHFRPYPPGRFRLSDTMGTSGAAYPAELYGTITAEWAHRDRGLQSDQLVDESAGSIGPEAGTTYTMRTYLGGVLDDEQAGISGTSASVTPSGNGAVRIEVFAVRDGVNSWQSQECTFSYRSAPAGKYVDQAGKEYADQYGNTYEG